ncbi:hypothetical protein B0H11DRAFT_1979864 [Mycena galericulata]|nr:hypothetical protein B0H11DRAFT_1979864 [Mycena galericulata]
MENLLFFDDFEGLGDVLSGADFVPCIANLRRLWMCMGPGHCSAIINAAVQKLEEVFLDCTGMYDVYTPELDPPSLHNFSSLRFFSIGLNFDDLDRPWVVSTLCSVLLSRAEEVIITYQCDSARIRTMSTTTMDSMNRVLSGCSVFPRIRWRLHSHRMDDAESILRDFTAVVEKGIPVAHEEGMLAVEYHSGDDVALSWPGGTPIFVQ